MKFIFNVPGTRSEASRVQDYAYQLTVYVYTYMYTLYAVRTVPLSMEVVVYYTTFDSTRLDSLDIQGIV